MKIQRNLYIDDFNVEFEEMKKSQPFLRGEASRNRFAEQPPLQPLRITINTDGLSNSQMTEQQKQYFLSIISTIQIFLQKLIKVIPSPSNNVFFTRFTTKCVDIEVPIEVRTTGIPNSDLHLYFIATNEPLGKFLADANWCSVSFSEELYFFRPNFGRVRFNTGKIKADFSSHYQYYNDLNMILHEVIHIFGFSSHSLNIWFDKNTGERFKIEDLIEVKTIRSIQTTILKSPNVLKTARKYYNCDSLSGMQFENQGEAGSIGSHWERTIIKNEMMTASLLSEGTTLSIFTTALLKDTGFWNDVNENLTGPIYWGKGKGCEFPIKACESAQNYEEFAKYEGQQGCTFAGSGYGYGYNDEFADKCILIYPFYNNLCIDSANNFYPNNTLESLTHSLSDYSYDSQCFKSTLNHPDSTLQLNVQGACFKYQCSPDNTEITIKSTRLEGFSTSCKIENQGKSQQVQFKSKILGNITCPNDFERFCGNQKCVNFCSSNGFCINGKCLCNPGSSGEDCSLTCPSYSQNGICVSSCSNNTYANPDNTCKTTCPRGYYGENGLCQLCDFSCSKCSGPQKNECLSCQFLTYLQGNECVKTCSYGSYADEITKMCKACPVGCKDCINEYQCGICNSGYAKQNGDQCSLVIAKTNLKRQN